MSEIVVRQGEVARITAQPGDVLLVELEENLATGYSWDLNALPEFLELLGSEHEAGPARPGSPGTRRIRLLVTARGEGVVGAQLRRPWERGVSSADQFSVTVSID